MDRTTSLRPISSPLLGTFHKLIKKSYSVLVLLVV